MTDPGQGVSATIAGGLAGEIVLVYLIGLCPVLALSRRFEAALGLGAVTVLMAPPATLLASLLALPFGHVVLALPYLVVAVFVSAYACARMLAAGAPGAYARLEAYVPMMAVSCTLLGIALIALHTAAGPLGAALHALGLAAGYALLLAAFSQLRERLSAADLPAPFRGAPIALVSLGILALAVSGFTGLRTL